MSAKAIEEYARQEKLEKLKSDITGSIGQPYGVTIQDGVLILLAETEAEIIEILKKYNGK